MAPAEAAASAAAAEGLPASTAAPRAAPAQDAAAAGAQFSCFTSCWHTLLAADMLFCTAVGDVVAVAAWL